VFAYESELLLCVVYSYLYYRRGIIKRSQSVFFEYKAHWLYDAVKKDTFTPLSGYAALASSILAWLYLVQRVGLKWG